MPTVKTKELRNRSYVGKDFDSFRTNLLDYARQYYADKINDFSDASMGGLLLDLSAYVGDVLSFYMDHQFTELDPETVVETVNIERMLRSSGVKITGASPSTVDLNFYVIVPSLGGSPRTDCLPIVRSNSSFTSKIGVQFILTEDVDFRELDSSGRLIAAVQPNSVSAGAIKDFVLTRTGVCISGYEISETFRMDGFVPFRRITLNNSNVNEIVSVTDGVGNKYYEVSSLTDDVVYKNISNTNSDSDLVSDILAVFPAPYRFSTEVSLDTRSTTLIMGGGSAATFEDDAIPDPSEFAIPMRYKKTFSRLSIDPASLLQTKTLGISEIDTTLTVIYRYGGGLDNNITENSLQAPSSLDVVFPGNPPSNLMKSVRDSIQVNNTEKARGGEDAPTIVTLKSLIPSSRNSQERIVTKSDLLSRVYTLPSNFGRVFRAATRPNPNNPLSLQLHVISRDVDSKLTVSPDTLKLNLKKGLNPYRMISDSIEILDVKVLNLQLYFEVYADPIMNKTLVIQSCIDVLKKYFDIKNWNIDQPINISEVSTVIGSVLGVSAVSSINFKGVSGTVNNNSYSKESFDVSAHMRNGFITTPSIGGSMFEIKYPDYDLIGAAV